MATPIGSGGGRGGAGDPALDGRAPVEETFGFVEEAIEAELDWLNAPSGPRKTLSFVLLALFPVAAFAGLWRRSWRLLAVSAALIAIFYLLMRSVAARS